MRIKCGIYLMIGLILVCGTVNAAAANSLHPKSKELKKIDQKIQDLQVEIKKDQGKKGLLAQQMKANITKLAKLQKKMTGLTLELKKQQSTIGNIEQQEENYQQKITAQRSLFAKQWLATYQLLVEGEMVNNPRILDASGYLHRAQLDNLEGLKKRLTELSTEQHHWLNDKMNVQTTLNHQQLSQKHLITVAHGEQHILGQLTNQIQNKNVKLNHLMADRAALDALIKKLQHTLQQQQQTQKHLPELSLNKLPNNLHFANVRGKLPWPTAGKMLANFGTPIAQSELKYTGVLFSVHNKQPVHAVYAGRVIFADWLQGLGLLLIIDHGGGYISLYGHNQVLYKKVGDVVKSQELIAGVGTNQQLEVSGLYFEIRHDGKPLNPAYWCG